MYRADFLDGPMQDEGLLLMGRDDPYADLYVMPNPTGSSMPWILIGYTGLEPDTAWPEQVHYELAGTMRDGGELVAKYALPLARETRSEP